ncbi:MAG: histidine kinase, partial [Cyanobacteria bacterium J06555_13]
MSQLNQGTALLTAAADRQELAELNLVASNRAKSAAANEAMLHYSIGAIALLPEEAWHTQYALSLSLHNNAAEAASLTGNFAEAQQYISLVEHHAHSHPDKTAITVTQIRIHVAEQKMSEAIAYGLQALTRLGLTIPQNPTPADFEQSLADTVALIPSAGPNALLELPPMTDLAANAALQILTVMGPVAFIANPPLHPMLVFAQVQHSIRFGNADLSAIAYCAYGLLLNAVLQDYQQGYTFSGLGLELAARFNSKAVTVQTDCIAAIFTHHWVNHLNVALPLYETSILAGLEAGDYDFTAWSYFHQGLTNYLLGTNLTDLESIVHQNSLAIASIQQAVQLNSAQVIHQAVQNLQGEAADPLVLSGKVIDETVHLKKIQTLNDATALYCLHFCKLQLAYLLGDYPSAAEQITLGLPYAPAVVGIAILPVQLLYTVLTQLALYTEQTTAEQAETLNTVQAHQAQMQKWADHAAMNCQHRVDLIQAEQYRIAGQYHLAADAYDDAIAGAKANGYIQEEALANELAAKFYLSRDKEKFATVYMQAAYYGYARWGAKVKTDSLEQQYIKLLQPILQSSTPYVGAFNPRIK